MEMYITDNNKKVKQGGMTPDITWRTGQGQIPTLNGVQSCQVHTFKVYLRDLH